jgi:hypothetical protein
LFAKKRKEKMSLTGTKRRVAQVIGVLGGLFFSLMSYGMLPTILYYSGYNFGNYLYFFVIAWMVAWLVLGYLILYGLVSLVVWIIKKIWP